MQNFSIHSSAQTHDGTTKLFWPLFASAYTAVTGHDPKAFRFDSDGVPMSTSSKVVTALVAYYTIILGGRWLMKDRPAYKLNTLFMIHNFYLTAISGMLLILHVEQIVPTLSNKGLLYSICRRKDGGWTPELEVLYYVRG